MSEPTIIEQRKADHIRVCWKEDVEAGNDPWADISLVHDALTDVDADSVDCSVELFGRRLAAPIIIVAMTGGTDEARRINRDLAALAQELGLGMGLGSQRIMVEQPNTTRTFEVRDVAPDILLLGNLGLVQFVAGWGSKEAMQAVEGIGADALCIHLNPAHEMAQPEGDRAFKGGEAALARLCTELEVPVVAKETGCGISRETAARLAEAGVSGIDVGGVGGTSWVAVEHYRDTDNRLAETFWRWGLPTPISVAEVRSACDLPVIATGGVRTGIDVVKSLRLGATAAGVALPVLRAYMDGGVDGARSYLTTLIAETRAAMLLCGASSREELMDRPLVLTGRTRDWLEQRT